MLPANQLAKPLESLLALLMGLPLARCVRILETIFIYND